MSTPKVVPTKLTPTERSKFVALRVKACKSNRAIAKEFRLDEGTIRLDRKFLATPENERPIKIPRPERLKRPQRHWKRMLTAAQLWITQKGLLAADLELYVLPDAGKLLYQYRHSLNQFPEPVKSPDELLSLTRPTETVEDYMPSKLPFYDKWLARWLACCLPREEELRDKFLQQTSIWARSWR
jgi:hypothetical protein